MYITENGCAYNDTFGHDNKIHDERRIQYMKQHLMRDPIHLNNNAIPIMLDLIGEKIGFKSNWRNFSKA